MDVEPVLLGLPGREGLCEPGYGIISAMYGRCKQLWHILGLTGRQIPKAGSQFGPPRIGLTR